MPTTNYIWDPVTYSYLMETDGSDATQAVYNVEPAHFGRVISQRRSSTTNYLHQDALGSTRQLTGAVKTTTDSWIFDAWGNEKVHSGSTTLPLTWVGTFGYLFDDVLESYYIRTRVYGARVARWNSLDRVGFRDGLHRYRYVLNTPWTAIDPSGTRAKVDFHDANGCCTIKDVKFICRTMPSAFHSPAMTHCYLAFTDGKGKWNEVISGQRDEETGKAVLSDTFWDLNWANHDKDWIEDSGEATQFEHPVVFPVSSPCDTYNCLFKAATELSGQYKYNQYIDNSNSFLTRIMRKCNISANFPPSAIASDDLPGWGGGSCVGNCLKPKNLVTATAYEVEECRARCKAFDAGKPKEFPPDAMR